MLALADLQSLVRHVTDPSKPGFYRRLYGLPAGAPARSISSLEEWRALPVLEKKALSDVPLAARSHLPLARLDHLRASSGTSGKPPLFSPRTHVRAMEYRLQYHDFKKPFLAFTVPMMPHWHARFQEEHGLLPRVVCFDPKHMRASVRLAKAAGVDALSVFVYHMTGIADRMKAEGMAERIRLLEITGEVCTRAQYDYLRAVFPNATIIQSYNSSEVEDAHIGMPCKPIDGSEPLAVYHPKATHYLEIVDAETGENIEPRAGAEGDLLITAYPGEPASFPLLRYRIGDTVRVVESDCGHGSWSFTVLGRTDLDFLKVPGGVLRADEIARVLRLFPERVTDRFELRCSEEPTPDGPKLRPVLCVEPRKETDLVELATDIANVLRVAPTLTWAEGVARRRYLPLSCSVRAATGATKTRRIVLT